MMSVIWPDRDAILRTATPIIKTAEGLRLRAYLCPAKIWTIGWGCTMDPRGRAIEPGMTITPADAEVFLTASAGRILSRLEHPSIITRSPGLNQAGAFLSLTYNIGVGVHDGVKGDFADSSIVENYNAGNVAAAARHFLDWDKARVEGVLVVLPGLATRRTSEMNLFLRPDTSATSLAA